MKRDLSLTQRVRSPFWKHSIHRISPLFAATVLLAAQNGWMFPLPARADKVDSSSNLICAVPGQDGSPTLSTGQVNTYFPGTSVASAGGNSISVGTAKGVMTAINPGDLLLVIQMQGADIDGTNTTAYGDGDSTNNPTPAFSAPGGIVNGNLSSNFTAGQFEYVVATNMVSTTGGSITISSPLVNSYVNADNTGGSSQGQRRFQVVRVPQYANLTVNGTISATPWDGASGGVVAMDVAGALTFMGAGQINVDGQGFRGGGARNLLGDSGTPTLLDTDVVTLSTRTANGSKGEGTAGTPKYLFNPNNTLITNATEGYLNGSYGRGAPGNAGGGGTDDYPITGNTGPDMYGNGRNTGGGGGSNGGPGGKGGFSWSTSKPYGGDGGAPFAVAAANRLVLGGGGGAGVTNNGTGTPSGGIASSGTAGGGMVLLRTGKIAGTGTISANGASPALIPANDGSGGAGAGGSVLVISQNGTTSGLTINVNGGKGGTNTGGGVPHGPGGGGGGGTVFASSGATVTFAGGSAGTTAGGVYGGATAGNGVSGPVSTTSTDATTSISGAGCAISATKSTSTPGPMAAPSTATYTITASNPIGAKRATANNVVISDSGLPAGFANSSIVVTPTYTGGATGAPTVTTAGTASQPTWSGFTIPPGGSVAITFTVTIANGTASGTYNNSATADAKYTNASANVTTVNAAAAAVTSVYDGLTSTAEDVTIAPASPLQVDKTVAIVVDSDGSGGTTPLANQVATPGDILEYTLDVKNTSPTTPVTNIVLTDPMPPNTTYVPGSLQVTAGANIGVKTDASADDQAEANASQTVFRLGTGANGTVGGTLAATATTTVKFRVKINDPITPFGTTQISNQASVSSTGYAPTPSNDPTTPAPGDPTLTKIGPRLRLVKRITGIKKSGSPTVTAIGGYNDLATDNDDNPGVNWPGGSSAYLLGAINASQVPTPTPGVPAPNDEVEYTVYFLSDGAMNAGGVDLCDFVPDKQTFVSGSIQLNFNGTTTAIVDGSGTGPGSGFFPTTFPSSCIGTNNNRGAVHLQIGAVPSVNGTPASSYGFFRFRAKVD